MAEKTSNEQVNRAVHKALGLCWHELAVKSSSYFHCTVCGQHPAYDSENIDYCNDLNFAMKFTDKLIADGLAIDIRSELTKGWLVWFHLAGHVKGVQFSERLAKAICLAGLAAIDSTEQASTDRENKCMTDINALLTYIETLRDKEPMCRDCADEDGTCPNRQWPCHLNESDLKALALRYKAYEAALQEIACFNDDLGNENLSLTGNYYAFDEPTSVKTAREALNGGE